MFSGLQDGPGTPPDPAEFEARRVRLLAGAQTTLNDHADVLAPLAAAFGEAGHELFLVGGSVRDALLGRLGTDLDFTTDARPDTVRGILEAYADTVWDTGIEFGTLSAVRYDAAGIEQQIEITTYRADSYDGVSRNPEVVFGDTLEGDLVRRDFTVNAM
ncbi:MAG: CCA tRNA nucleotidyltransferase, partial [Dietzia cercidiphylli]